MKELTGMEFIIDGKVATSADICSQCGMTSPSVSRELRLCKTCLEERQSSEEVLKKKVRTRFNLTRSPDLRSCFLKQLLLKDVNLEPSGWRRGLALGFELKDNGFGEVEAEQILAQASGQAERSRRLMEAVYRRMKGPQGAWTCLQLKDLEMICSNCVSQFKAAPRESITEICSDGGQQEMPRQSGRE